MASCNVKGSVRLGWRFVVDVDEVLAKLRRRPDATPYPPALNPGLPWGLQGCHGALA